MRNPPRLLFGLAFLLALTAPLSAAKDKGLDVLISSDAISSPEGFRPKADKPIHYLLMQNRQTLGEIIAGVKLPDLAVVESAVVAELKKQGFARTDVGGSLPEIVIVATIGDANFEQPPPPPSGINPLLEPDFAPYLYQVNVRQLLTQNLLIGKVSANTAEELFTLLPTISTNDPDTNEARELVLAEAVRIRERSTDRGRDRPKLLALVGANKVEKAVGDRTMGGIDAERIVRATRDNLLYVTLTAFDAAAWKEKQKVVLWRTTMLIDWRVDFSKALTEMLAQAGPVFGTDVAVPGFVNTAKSREGKVEVGPAKVVPEKDAKPEPAAKK
jgi:hypothetical protein